MLTVWKIIASAVLLCFAAGSVHLARAQSRPSFTFKATVWSYGTLCEFKEPANWPRLGHVKGAEEMMALSCESLGHPEAIQLTVSNTTSKEAEFVMDGLDYIKVQLKDGTLKTPKVLVVKQAGFGGPVIGFLVGLKGQLKVLVPPAGNADLMFLFDKAERGDSIRLKGGPMLNIE